MTTATLVLRAPQGTDFPFLDFGTAFQNFCKTAPDKVAVIDELGSHSWQDFGALAFRVAGRLHQDGFAIGTPVAALADNSAAFLAVYAGVVLAGGCVVPLPTSAQPETLQKMLADCGASVLFASAKLFHPCIV